MREETAEGWIQPMSNPRDLGQMKAKSDHSQGLVMEWQNFWEMTAGLSDRGGEKKDEEWEK